MAKDLHLTGIKYQLAAAVFFVCLGLIFIYLGKSALTVSKQDSVQYDGNSLVGSASISRRNSFVNDRASSNVVLKLVRPSIWSKVISNNLECNTD